MIPRYSLVLAVPLVAAIAALGFRSPNDSALRGMAFGAPNIQSVGPLAVGPSGVLFVGDTKGAAVYALAFEHEPARGTARPIQVEGIDAKIAAVLGTTPKEIMIRDMAADSASRVLYFSVMRGRGPDGQPSIVRMTATGEVEAVRIDSAQFSKLELDRAPNAEQRFQHEAWRNTTRRLYAVRDLAYANGELYVTGVTNEEFASSFRRVAFPFNGRASLTHVSMYHTSHGMYETEAPIETFLPITLGGEPVILAGYACTPIAKFPMNGLTNDGQLRGTTVMELGSGNRANDMLAIDRNGEQYVLIVNSSRGVARVKASDLARARSLTSPVENTAGPPYTTLPLENVREIEPLSKNLFVLLQRNADSTLSVRTADSRAF